MLVSCGWPWSRLRQTCLASPYHPNVSALSRGEPARKAHLGDIVNVQFDVHLDWSKKKLALVILGIGGMNVRQGTTRSCREYKVMTRCQLMTSVKKLEVTRYRLPGVAAPGLAAVSTLE